MRSSLHSKVKFGLLFSAGVSQSLCVTVSDTGIGIPEEYHRNVFEAFRQVDGSTSRKYGGTGLGLSIVKQLLEALGGRINLKSAIGKGSTFTIHLPNMVREASTTHTHKHLSNSTWNDLHLLAQQHRRKLTMIVIHCRNRIRASLSLRTIQFSLRSWPSTAANRG